MWTILNGLPLVTINTHGPIHTLETLREVRIVLVEARFLQSEKMIYLSKIYMHGNTSYETTIYAFELVTLQCWSKNWSARLQTVLCRKI